MVYEHSELIETLNILSDGETMSALAQAEDDLAADNLFELCHSVQCQSWQDVMDDKEGRPREKGCHIDFL